MRLVFVEALAFTRNVRSYLDDEGYRALQQGLLRNPEQGDLIPTAGGLRKLRWGDASRSKGKRGGLRVIYAYLPDEAKLYLFTLYGKDEIEDLTKAQYAALGKALKAELAARSAVRLERAKGERR